MKHNDFFISFILTYFLTLSLLFFVTYNKYNDYKIIFNVKNIDYIEDLKEKELSFLKNVTNDKLADEIFAVCEKYNQPIYVILALIDTESNFNEKANSKLSPKNGRGIIQVSDIALKEYNNHHVLKFKKTDMYISNNCLEVGVWYFNRIKEHYLENKCTYTDVYLAYNVGPNYYKNHVEELYNNTYKDGDYYALKVWDKNLTKYYKLFIF